MVKYITLGFMMIIALTNVYGQKNKETIEQHLIGIWVLKQDSNNESLRFIKANALEKNNRGYEFKENNVLIMRETFGCQMPYPNYKNWQAKWKVINKNTVIVYDHYPGEEPLKMKIMKLNKRVLRMVMK
jgi:hypothetical protein